ncbi:MAG: SusC/RagA family TonB-linked outer membrane protein [Bacteroidales bacterium]|nr:SusC/RagA family TonB-linked outer membrane protein [Bacteroidales bacterium]
MSLLMPVLGFAQTRQVTGKVTSAEDGSPVYGATVFVEGTSIAAATNADGVFVLRDIPASAKDKPIVISCLGYAEAKVAMAPQVNVVLDTDNFIDEIVVTAVGIQRSERSLGYAVTKVDASEAIQRAEPDPLRALDGKIAGVQISAPSGDAGGATRVTIRGNSSFLGNNQPLYVVDGVPYSNDGVSASGRGGEIGAAYGSGIATLDPNDIESMSVLKGAAAAVLYGSRAANGVILITTKSGSKAANEKKGYSVTLSTSYALESIASLPEYQNTYGQGSDFKIGATNGSWGKAFEDGDVIDYGDITAEYPDLALKLYPDLGGKYAYKAFPNNVKDLFRQGSVWDNSINVQNVNDKGNFNVTASYTTQDSYIPGSNFDRYAFSLGGNQQVTAKLRIGGNLAYTLTNQDSPLYGNNQSSQELGGMSSLARAFIMPRSWDIQNFPYKKLDGSNLLFQLSSQANNPYWAWENDKVSSEQKRMVANFNANYRFTSWLSLDYTLGYNDYSTSRKTLINLGSRGYAGKGYISKSVYNDSALESTLLLTADKDFAKDFNIRATIGHNYNQDTANSFAASGPEMVNPEIYSIGNTKSQSAGESYSRTRKWGVFADMTLSYKNYAFLNFSGRNDVSSTLPIEHNSFFYPAVSGSFVFTEALGIEESFLNFGKIRAGWAKVGNDAGPYYNNGTYVISNPYMGQGMMELPTVLFDPELKPEFTTETEAGVELKFFKSRIGIDATYYNRISDNQIGAKTSAASTGYSSYYTNFGSLQNKGIELGVDLYPVVTNDFSWGIYTVFTKNKSEVLSLADGVEKIYVGGDFTTPRPVLIVGQPYGVLEGEKIARTDDGTPLVSPATGMYLKDPNVGIIGDPNPDYKLSMTNTLRWKGLALSFMFDFQKGGCINSSYLTDLLGRGVTKDTENRLGGRILPGVYGDPDTMLPVLDAEGNCIPNTTQIGEADLWFTSDSNYSTYAVNGADEVATYDATVLRLRELSLSYQLPKKLLSKVKIAGAEIGVVGRNLWFFAPNVPKYSNFDPIVNAYGETNVQGIDYTAAPSVRRWAFNLKLTF